MTLLISGASIIDGVSDKPREGQTIWIEGERIRAIGRRDEWVVAPSATIIDARGKYVIPGLIDANVHLLLDTRLENLVRHEACFEDLIVEAAQVTLKAGLTTVFDTWGPRRPLMAVRDRIRSGALQGSRIFCAGNIIGLDGPISPDFHSQATNVASGVLARRINSLWVENTGPDLSWMTPDQVAHEVRAYIGTGIDFVKYASSEHRGSEPNAFLVFSPEVQSRIVAEAHRVGITAQAHTSSVEALRIAVEAGCNLIQHANITGPVQIPDSTLQRIVDRGTGAVVFPFTERRLHTMKTKCEAPMRRTFSTADLNCRNLMRSGARLLLATDAGLHSSESMTDPRLKNNWSIGGDDNLAELGQGHFHWLKAMEEKGYPAIEGLRAATRNIANAYGMGADLGTLEADKLADMLILDRNPLQSSENYRSIYKIIKNGKVVDHHALPAHPILTRPAVDGETSPSYGRYAFSQYPSCC